MYIYVNIRYMFMENSSGAHLTAHMRTTDGPQRADFAVNLDRVDLLRARQPAHRIVPAPLRYLSAISSTGCAFTPQ